MRKIAILLAAVCCVSSVFAQINIGADYFYLGEYEKAEYYLKKHLESDPVKANFYLGEVAFARGEMAKAAEFYNKALALDPAFIPAQVAVIKLKIKSNPTEAENLFKALSKANRKSAPLAVEIGRAYLQSGMLDKANQRAAEAVGYNKQYAPIYILEGDIMAAAKDPQVGDITGKYEQAKYFNDKELLAYMKLALVYERRNPSSAIENLQKALSIDPNYSIAQGLLGYIYASSGRYPEAIQALKTYFAGGLYSANDIERMARAYFFGDPEKLGISEQQKYEEAMKWVREGLQKDPNHFVLNRYKMYLDAKTGSTDAALADAERFFKLRDSDTTYLPMDYTMYGTILKGAGRTREAIAQYEKAISLDPSLLETYDEAVSMARDLRDYNLAAQYYEKMVEAKKRSDEEKYKGDRLVDINSLGNLYYQAGTTLMTNVKNQDGTVSTVIRNPELMDALMADPAWQQKLLADNPALHADSLRGSRDYFTAAFGKYNLLRAETLFKELIEQAPESYMGYYYLARTSNALYPGAEGIASGIPKEYYGKTVEIIEGRENGLAPSALMLRALKEGLGYLAYYYYMKDDLENASLYSTKLLEIDPENANAKAILEDIKNRKA